MFSGYEAILMLENMSKRKHKVNEGARACSDAAAAFLYELMRVLNGLRKDLNILIRAKGTMPLITTQTGV